MKKIMLAVMALFFMAATSGLVLADSTTPATKNANSSKKHGCHGKCNKNHKDNKKNQSSGN